MNKSLASLLASTLMVASFVALPHSAGAQADESTDTMMTENTYVHPDQISFPRYISSGNFEVYASTNLPRTLKPHVETSIEEGVCENSMLKVCVPGEEVVFLNVELSTESSYIEEADYSYYHEEIGDNWGRIVWRNDNGIVTYPVKATFNMANVDYEDTIYVLRFLTGNSAVDANSIFHVNDNRGRGDSILRSGSDVLARYTRSGSNSAFRNRGIFNQSNDSYMGLVDRAHEWTISPAFLRGDAGTTIVSRGTFGW